LTACTNIINTPIEHFTGKSAMQITPSKIIDLEKFGILKPLNFIQINDSIFFIYDVKDKNLFNLINISSLKTTLVVNHGQGPNEVLAPSSMMYKNNQILVYDAMPKKMYEMASSSDSTLALKEVYRIETNTFILFRVHLLDSTFIATGWFENYWLAEMNKDGEIISTIDYPVWNETKDISKNALSTLYSTAWFANSPDNKRVAVAATSQGVISFLNRTSLGIQEYKQIKYHASTFVVSERGRFSYSEITWKGLNLLIVMIIMFMQSILVDL
jgi:hypothetical protein